MKGLFAEPFVSCILRHKLASLQALDPHTRFFADPLFKNLASWFSPGPEKPLPPPGVFYDPLKNGRHFTLPPTNHGTCEKGNLEDQKFLSKGPLSRLRLEGS